MCRSAFFAWIPQPYKMHCIWGIFTWRFWCHCHFLLAQIAKHCLPLRLLPAPCLLLSASLVKYCYLVTRWNTSYILTNHWPHTMYYLTCFTSFLLAVWGWFWTYKCTFDSFDENGKMICNMILAKKFEVQIMRVLHEVLTTWGAFGLSREGRRFRPADQKWIFCKSP